MGREVVPGGADDAEAALRLRLAEVCRRLRETDEPVAAITAACGWPDPAPPKRLFKKRFGVSMREWRNSSAKAGTQLPRNAEKPRCTRSGEH